MTFLQPLLLFALPLAALPVVIHLIHHYRRRQVQWAAMMFLQAAQRMNKGLTRLRQLLILALRVLAVLAIIFAITRPLAGGWLGLTGGAPDTVLILLDRSASMEQQNTATGVSKRVAGLRNVAKAINDAVGTRSRLVLIDSALAKPQSIDKADALLDLPYSDATDTGADIPGLLQSALDYVTTNKTGRTDVWMLSDLQKTDWDRSGGRWETLRAAFGRLQGVRFHILGYPQKAPDDLSITVDRVVRQQSGDKARLLLDLRILRHVENPVPTELPLRFVVNGVASSVKVTIKDNQWLQQGYSIPIDKSLTRGWGRVELPADACPGNNIYNFVFDEPPSMHSVIVSDDESVVSTLKAALSAPADPTRKYQVTVLSSQRAAEIPWDDAALIVWQTAIPKGDSVIGRQLQDHTAAGRSLLFLPPDAPDDSQIFATQWGRWNERAASDKPLSVESWRNDADLLANTRDGAALPVGSLEISRMCGIVGAGVPLAQIAEHGTLLMRSAGAQNAYFLGTLPSSGASSLARDGVVLFAMLHRTLNDGVRSLGKARMQVASANALGADPTKWRRVENNDSGRALPSNLGLHAGVLTTDTELLALNRPAAEDAPQSLVETELNELLAGLDFRVLTDSLDDGRSLTNEIWRNFLLLMALALLGETLLCLPGRRDAAGAASRTNAKGFFTEGLNEA